MSHLVDEEEIRRLSRRIAAEFEATYGTLDEKVSRVPDEAAAAIAEACGVHLEVARVAYRVMLDGTIPDPKQSCRILMREFKRRSDRGNPVPEINSYQRSVALVEGKWIQYLYGQLLKVLLQEIRNLANLSRTVEDEIEPASEQVLAVLHYRQKIAQVYFSPLLKRWVNDHSGATIANAMYAITGGLLGHSEDSIVDALTSGRASLLIKFRRYEQFLRQDEEESKLLEKTLVDIRHIIEEVQLPLSQLSETTASEVLIEVLPPPRISIDEKPKYGFVHPAFPAQARMGPPMKSPLDFLERDVWLAVMQAPSERAKFLREKISTVIDNLLQEGQPLDQMGTTIIFDLDDRFKWKRSKKTVIRKEINQLKETAGEDYRGQIETYILENILRKIPQLRSTPSSSIEK